MVSNIQHEGTLGPHNERQEGPHAHQTYLLPDNHFLSADLGLDQIKVYKIEDDSALKKVAELKLPAGSGPRHLAFHPNNQYFYVFGELDNTISSLHWDSSKKTSM